MLRAEGDLITSDDNRKISVTRKEGLWSAAATIYGFLPERRANIPGDLSSAAVYGNNIHRIAMQGNIRAERVYSDQGVFPSHTNE